MKLFVNSIVGGVLTGRAIDVPHEMAAIAVEVYADGIVIGTADIAVQGSAETPFTLELDGRQLIPPYTIRVCNAGMPGDVLARMQIDDGQQHAKAMQPYRGSVLSLRGKTIKGRVVDNQDPARPVMLEVSFQGRVIGSTLSDPDGTDASPHGSFHFMLPSNVVAATPSTLSVGAGPEKQALAFAADVDFDIGPQQWNAKMSALMEQGLGDLVGTAMANAVRRSDALIEVVRDNIDREIGAIKRHLGIGPGDRDHGMSTPPDDRIVADESLLGFGWFETEYSPDEGPFRWMSEHATVISPFHSRIAPATLVITGHTSMGDCYDSLEVRLNNHKVDIAFEPGASGWAGRCLLDVGLWEGRNYSFLSFHAKDARYPSSGDPRKLSVSLRSIALTTATL